MKHVFTKLFNHGQRSLYMSYPAKVIANYFIKKAIEQNDKSLNLMKLLKLLYIAQGWSLAMFDRKIINEPIDAWKYGPVVANIYHSLKTLWDG